MASPLDRNRVVHMKSSINSRAELLEQLGLPADADVKLTVAPDASGDFRLDFVYLAAPEAPAPVVPPKAQDAKPSTKGKGAPVAVAKPPEPQPQPAAASATNDEDLP